LCQLFRARSCGKTARQLWIKRRTARALDFHQEHDRAKSPDISTRREFASEKIKARLPLWKPSLVSVSSRDHSWQRNHTLQMIPLEKVAA
jgi:hypothetical protein